MPTEAKLGFAVGISLVIVVAVVAFRTESAGTTGDPAAITTVKPDPTTPMPRENRRKATTKAAAPNSSRSTQLAGGQAAGRDFDNSRTPTMDVATGR